MFLGVKEWPGFGDGVFTVVLWCFYCVLWCFFILFYGVFTMFYFVLWVIVGGLCLETHRPNKTDSLIKKS